MAPLVTGIVTERYEPSLLPREGVGEKIMSFRPIPINAPGFRRVHNPLKNIYSDAPPYMGDVVIGADGKTTIIVTANGPGPAQREPLDTERRPELLPFPKQAPAPASPTKELADKRLLGFRRRDIIGAAIVLAVVTIIVAVAKAV